ncbi:MAG: tetratricopeptide repeat protein [Deltaproteobacteria bacterium]
MRVGSSQCAVLVLAAGFSIGCGGAESAGPGAAAPGQGTPDSDLASLQDDDTPSPSSPEFEQGVAAIREEKFELARERFERVVAAQPRNAQAIFYLGVAQQNLGQLPAAQASYQKATELSPKLADAWVNWTATLLDAEDAAAAMPVIERGLAQNPKHSGLLYNHALALSALRKREEAVPAYRLALEADPGNAEIKFGYAEALITAGSKDQGLKLLAELANSDNPEVLASTGALLGRLEQFDTCISVFSKAIERKAAAELYVQRGLCQHGKKDDEAAVADFQKAIQTDANYAPAHYYVGMHLRMKGKKAEAKQALSRAVQIAGDEGVGKAAKRALESL